MAFVGFDRLHVSGQDVMREPWRDRRKRLEDVVAGAAMPGVTIVPTTVARISSAAGVHWPTRQWAVFRQRKLGSRVPEQLFSVLERRIVRQLHPGLS